MMPDYLQAGIAVYYKWLNATGIFGFVLFFPVMWLFLLQAVYHHTYCQQQQLEQWAIATCGGR